MKNKKIKHPARQGVKKNKTKRSDMTRANTVYSAQGKEAPTAKIKVVGVGGAGGNALSRMYDYFPRGVDLIAVNTDLQDLHECQARKKIYIGKQITKGLGAGMNPELGKQAAEENREDIAKALEGADMVFLTAGFGGGTGSGAAPVVAEIAQEMGILTVAVVTRPFSFEGTQRTQIAQEALLRLKDRVDTYITIANDKIFSVIDADTTLRRAFEEIDEVLKNAVLGITELIMSAGIINVDFADIKAIVQNSGPSIIGVGMGSGKDRALSAARSALSSPLLETVIDGAKGVLFSISGHRDIKMNEVDEIAKAISENVDPNARIIFGTYNDRKVPKGHIKVTVIATGFGSSFGKNISLFGDFERFNSSGKSQNTLEERVSPLIAHEPIAQRKESLFDLPAFVKKEDSHSTDNLEQHLQNTDDEEESEKTHGFEEQEEENDDKWEIPAFLRRKKK
jgi:cell division protein FtsZ